MKCCIPWVLFFIFLGCKPTTPTYFSEVQLFKNGTLGYACFRIPALIQSADGTLIAFVEGRKDNCSDFGNVDLLMVRSSDGGQQWSAPQMVVDNGSLQAGNPAPVLDTFDPDFPEGRLFLFYNLGDVSEQDMRLGKGKREVWLTTSTDNGLHWEDPTDISAAVHFNSYSSQPERDWRTHANTPGHAIQLKQQPFRGRLYVPANHSQGPPQVGYNEYRAYGFYSDDHGKTWSVSPDVDIPSSNEAIGVELPDGTLLLNIREQNGTTKRRLIAKSEDGGEHWSATYFDAELPSPVCQSSVLLFEGEKDTLLLYSGPNSTNKREKMTVFVSHDYGENWSIKKEIYPNTAAYSDLVAIDKNHIGLLYERDNEGLYFARFNLDWLLTP